VAFCSSGSDVAPVQWWHSVPGLVAPGSSGSDVAPIQWCHSVPGLVASCPQTGGGEEGWPVWVVAVCCLGGGA